MRAKYALLIAVSALAAGGVYYVVSRTPVGDARLIQGALGKRSQEGPAVQVTTGGYDNARTNADLSETILTPANVRSASFGKVFSLPVDGQIHAQPLYLQNVAAGSGKPRNVVYVCTMHNSVYAFDAETPGTPLWSVNLGPSVPTAKYSNEIQGVYTDILPENGILGTPVIDAGTGTLYVVAATYEGGQYFYRLHALDVTNGAEKAGAPVAIAGNVVGTGDGSKDGVLAFNPLQHLQRPALLLVNGNVYVAFGAHGDADPFHGWVMGYSAENVQKQVSMMTTTPSGGGGSFWQAGRGLAADESGNIYGVTGNGDTDSTANFSDSVVRLDPTATKVADWFTPYNVDRLNADDTDLGTTGAMLIPGTNLLVTAGKEGAIYLLDRTNLGHSAAGDSQIVQRLDAGDHYLIFNMALWNRPDGPLLYTHFANEPVVAYKLQGGKLSAGPVAASHDGFNVPYQGMTVSANGYQAGTGVVWVLGPVGSPQSAGVLHAYNAEGIQEIWNSTQNDADAVGKFTKFANPTVANGRVYVPTLSNSLVVYGLTAGAANTDPVVTGIVNAASYTNGRLAPGEIVTIFGQNLGPQELAGGALDANGLLSAQLAGTQVTFNGIPGPLYAASAGSVTAIVPFEVAGAQTVNVVVSYRGKVAQTVSMLMAETSPGLFAADASGRGPGSIMNADGTPNSVDQAAVAGSVVVLSATGGGVTDPPGTSGIVSAGGASVVAEVTATVDGQAAKVVYCGASAGQVAGALQISLRLPFGVHGTVPVVVTMGGRASQSTVTVSIQ